MGYGELLRLQKKYFCKQKNTSGHQLDIEKIRSESSSHLEVKATYGTLLLHSEVRIDKHVTNDILQSILDLYIRVCSFSYAKDIVQNYKITQVASKESNQGRQP